MAVVAVPGREPRPLLFDGLPLLPSAVCVDPTGRLLVGRDALHTSMADPASFEPIRRLPCGLSGPLWTVRLPRTVRVERAARRPTHPP